MNPSLYRRIAKPQSVQWQARRDLACVAIDKPQIISVDKATECHVTPPDWAEAMAYHLCVKSHHHVLEPHGGTGNLIQAVFDLSTPPKMITTVERHYKLVQVIEQRFAAHNLDVIQDCFLDYASSCGLSYQRIIDNPPFSNVKAHMNAALSLLKPSADDEAIMIALVPVTYQHSEANVLDYLPLDAFPTVNVATKIIEIIR
jgi:phospholipid N-methyltransferase